MNVEEIGNNVIKVGSNINRLIAELTSEINKLNDSRTWIVDNSDFIINSFKESMIKYSKYYGNICKQGNDIINYAKYVSPTQNNEVVYLDQSEEPKYKINEVTNENYKKGDKVKIISGKYEGIIGTIENISNDEVSIKIPSLLTSFLVDVFINQIEKKQ